MPSTVRDMEVRVQTLEQAVLGIGTGNGLLREVKAMRAEMAEAVERIERAIADERDERKAEWSDFYRKFALGMIAFAGSVGSGVLIAILSR